MDLLETNSSRQSIQKYIDNNIPLYLVIQKGIDVVCKLIVVKCIEINEIDNNIWWMEYIEKGYIDSHIIHSHNSKYITLYESDEEALYRMINSLRRIRRILSGTIKRINTDIRMCELSANMHASISKKKDKLNIIKG